MSNLQFEDGIWFSGQNQKLYYPAEGNTSCYQVEDKSYWFKYRNSIIKYCLEKYLTKDGSIQSFLDVGGGNGFVSKAMQDDGLETTLLEPSVGVHNAKKRGIKNIYCCPIESLPKNHTYDFIGMFDVIEHIEKPVPFLKEANSHLKAGGKILMTVPCYNFLWSEEDVKTGHFRRYTVARLSAELQEANLELLYSTYFFSFLIPPILVGRVLFDYLPFRKKQKPRHSSDQADLVASSTTTSVLNMLFSVEQWMMKTFGRLGFGASLIVVAAQKESHV